MSDQSHLDGRLRELLHGFRDGQLSEEQALQQLAGQVFEQHVLGRLDPRRTRRTGVPEAVYAEGKDPSALHELFVTYLEREEQLIATRVGRAELQALEDLLPRLHHDAAARVLSVHSPSPDPERGQVLVITAGALDRPIAAEVLAVSQLLGNPTEALYDVGVAGLARLAPELPRLAEAAVIVVAAGMDGALPSVIAGLVQAPVVAVPTSVGYGASFGGLASLLTMLNSCSPGVAVVNIDNGFGAAAMATKINLARVSD